MFEDTKTAYCRETPVTVSRVMTSDVNVAREKSHAIRAQGAPRVAYYPSPASFRRDGRYAAIGEPDVGSSHDRLCTNRWFPSREQLHSRCFRATALGDVRTEDCRILLLTRGQGSKLEKATFGLRCRKLQGTLKSYAHRPCCYKYLLARPAPTDAGSNPHVLHQYHIIQPTSELLLRPLHLRLRCARCLQPYKRRNCHHSHARRPHPIRHLSPRPPVNTRKQQRP